MNVCYAECELSFFDNFCILVEYVNVQRVVWSCSPRQDNFVSALKTTYIGVIENDVNRIKVRSCQEEKTARELTKIRC